MKAKHIDFSRLDWVFADFLTQRSQLTLIQKPTFTTLVAQLSWEHTQGHSCLKINQEQQQLLVASGLTLLADRSTSLDEHPQPLVIESGCLYMHRYWFYESRLALQLKQRLQRYYQFECLEQALVQYFPAPTHANEQDWACIAAKIAITHAFAIVTGGPGTGKTTTVVKILALLQQLTEQPLRIALAAPTGKAAMRLQESIIHSKQSLNCSENIKHQIPEQVSTLHGLLGAKPPPSPYFNHHADHRLPYDLVVIDEASMVDLALMSKLVDALATNTRLILLGDKDQLASVESGSVLADLISSLQHYSVELLVSHRFGGHIKALAVAVNEQRGEDAWKLLTTSTQYTIGLMDKNIVNYIAQKYHLFLNLIQQHAPLPAIMNAFNQFQVLCSNRQGDQGIYVINTLVEKALGFSGHWYEGRPVMMTENHPNNQLYNGDIGICLGDQSQFNKLMVYFLAADGQVKKYLPSRLARCETVYAMTIHKSQGSEFEEVLMMLPDNLNPVLTKELIYTGITRAKKKLNVVAKKTVFIRAIAKKIERHGGLKEKIKRG